MSSRYITPYTDSSLLIGLNQFGSSNKDIHHSFHHPLNNDSSCRRPIATPPKRQCIVQDLRLLGKRGGTLSNGSHTKRIDQYSATTDSTSSLSSSSSIASANESLVSRPSYQVDLVTPSVPQQQAGMGNEDNGSLSPESYVITSDNNIGDCNDYYQYLLTETRDNLHDQLNNHYQPNPCEPQEKSEGACGTIIWGIFKYMRCI